MGRYLVRIAEEYYDMDDCDSRGYPIKKIRYTGEEYETYADPDGDLVESGPDGWETHTVIGGSVPRRTYNPRYGDKEEKRESFVYKKGTRRSFLIGCANKYITQANISTRVKKIGSFVFDDCFDLETIVLPPSVEEIDGDAFVGHKGGGAYYHGCTITFSNEWKRIPSHVLPSNTGKLSINWSYIFNEIRLPDSILEIDDYAFSNMKLDKMNIPDSIEKMGTAIFSGSRIIELSISESTWLKFKDSITQDAKAMVACCGTKLLYYNYSFFRIPDLFDYGDYAFAQCHCLRTECLAELSDYGKKEAIELSHFSISNTVKSIGKGCFMGCTLLVSVEIPESVTYLGDEAFKDCTNLEKVTIYANIPWIGINTFEGCSRLKTVMMSRKLYKKSKWKFPKTTEFLFF